MPVDVVIGLQGGDEGKGKIAEYLGVYGSPISEPQGSKNYSIAIRSSAPQAGHSIMMNGERVGLANLPCPVKNKNLRLLIGRGALVSIERLFKSSSARGKVSPAEIPATGVTAEQLGIDYMTRVVTPEHKKREEENNHLMGKIGSIGTGVSECRKESIMRPIDLPRAKDYPEFEPYLTDTKKELFYALSKNQSVLLETDHGAKLDLIHGEYPYVTSRIVNAAGFLAECGIPVTEVRDIYGVIKPYTTRVADGPLEREVFDEQVLDWTLGKGGESGSVSGRNRRIGAFEWDNISEVIKMNGVTKLAITHMDAPEFVWKSIGYDNAQEFINELQDRICDSYPSPKIAFLSNGPELNDIEIYR